jgi:hypothetical protein
MLVRLSPKTKQFCETGRVGVRHLRKVEQNAAFGTVEAQRACDLITP